MQNRLSNYVIFKTFEIKADLFEAILTVINTAAPDMPEKQREALLEASPQGAEVNDEAGYLGIGKPYPRCLHRRRATASIEAGRI